MSNVSSIRDGRTTSELASEWVALLAAGDLSPEDRARLHAWLREHPGHQAAFDEVNRTWVRIRAMGEELRRHRTAEHGPKAVARYIADAGRDRRPRRHLLPAAAAALAVAVAAVLLLTFESGTRYRTDIGQQMTVTLPDRSTVKLNTDTDLVVAYTDRRRGIELQRGEAWFDVQHDPDRPFVIEVGGSAIRAIGTSFAVHLNRDVVRVTVTDGVVEVTQAPVPDESTREPSSIRRSESRPARVSKGQRLEFDQRVGSVVELPATEIARDLAWRQGLLVFEDQSLDEVLREIGRYTDTRLIIADDRLHRLRVGGAFRAGDLEAVLEFFEKLQIDVDRDAPNNTVYLTAPASDGRQ